MLRKLDCERMRKMRRFLLATTFVCVIAGPSHAALQFVGKDSDLRFDVSRFPPHLKGNYEIMKSKCTRCHSMERIAVSYKSGIAPISGRPFDMDGLKGIIFGMLRKANSREMVISKDDAKAISGLMRYMLDESVR